MMDVQDYLRSFEQPWKAPLEERLRAASPPLNELVRSLIKEPRDYRERERREVALADFLHGSTEADQSELAALLFPQLPETAQRTINALLTRHPYPESYARRAFRAPGERVQAVRAASWLMVAWQATRDYPQNLEWFAVHAGLLNSWSSHNLGLLLGQAVSDGSAPVLQILRDTASTQHPVARMGRHVPLALLSSIDPAAWALAEGLLLAAQRQEGLRQVILETVDEAGPEPFARMLRLILQEDLLRFAAVLRAACVWFGLNYDVTDLKVVRGLLTRALSFLEDAEAARTAVRGGSGVDAYLALYVLAMRDAAEAAGLARPLLQDTNPERRMAAAQFLLAAGRLDQAGQAALIRDPDPRLAALAGGMVNRWSQPDEAPTFTFEDYLAYAQRLPDSIRSGESSHQPLLFPWLGHLPARAEAVDTLSAVLGDTHISRLAPYLGQMSGDGKTYVLKKIEQRHKENVQPIDTATRELLLTLLQDRNSGVSQATVEVMAHLTPNPGEIGAEEVGVIQTLLKRKSADLRRGLIRLLARDAALAEASALELLRASNTDQRQAGLQLLQEVGAAPPADFEPRNVSEQTLYARLTEPGEQLSLDDGLGLFDPAERTPFTPLEVRERDYPQEVQRGAELLQSLDALIAANRETPLLGVGYDGEQTILLGNVSGWMLRPNSEGAMPLAELWDGWWEGRADPQDGDLTRMGWTLGHYVARKDTTTAELENELDADAAEDLDDDEDEEEVQATLQFNEARQHLLRQTLHRTLGPLAALWLEHADLLRAVHSYLLDRFRGGLDTTLALDAWETALAYLPQDAQVLEHPDYTWRSEDPRSLLSPLRGNLPIYSQSDDVLQRYWRITLYQNAAFPNLPRWRPDTRLLLLAYGRGWVGRTDLLDQLIGRPPETQDRSSHNNFNDLGEYTRHKLRDNLPTHPDWLAAVDEVRARVLEVEVTRGDLETPATQPALALQSASGAALPLRLLAGLGKNPLKRGYQGRNESRDVTFSHLIRVSFPAPQDTHATFTALVNDFKLADARLLDLAMFAPQWADSVAAALGWKGLRSGVYWLHAHTKESNWSVPQDIRDSWEAEIAERTPLSAGDLTEGAVDVAWFRQMNKALGKERFVALLEAAKYASSSGGHKRAELFARAILGELAEDDLRARIADKRNQDAVRALGLLPLSRAKAKQARELESRYRLLSDFRRAAKQFGAQRQASERLAADIGMQNLARSAGYSDPQRLMWAMEARMAPDWQATVTAEGVTLGIDMTPQGEASLTLRRGEKPLKTLPPALKKNPEVIALRAAVTELKATRGRMRTALEEAMVRGDFFTPQELTDLGRHPVISPMLGSLLWVLNEHAVGWWQGGQLQTHDGPQDIGEQAVRLAHPHDLYLSGHWSAFQQQIMEGGLTQPFKQAFREYYPLTAAEQGGALRSQRYAGHHVQPGKAAALFKARGWVTVADEGVRKTFHHEGLNVWVDTSVGYGTPNEVEGAALNAVYFVRQDETDELGRARLVPLTEVPPRVLSETLRDLDLVVGVAHVGGVDSEASLSTVDMRTDLLRETLRLLKLGNVRLENSHALIAGQYANYTVHLGSGTVHRMPGGFLCVIPVHNQHAGRLFLPFADPDPKTAEVISKVLLLAEDRKIQDPTILEQLR
ncbi:DUF5724 domain-containing protein [Deinococcus arenicola]|uniref:DUF5724 domain-containing protein n=1 Tax=Deinococcus arenicola TaxID=2994950 RepID=A0ABU4DX50_9DEIO|nr:DUF5724 domain-containing protein [Deinococcus sp. ZS9-10]MDV6376537.1 DUF5724 domain-containing protein [Deinococcus sp. ZS9-10]